MGILTRHQTVNPHPAGMAPGNPTIVSVVGRAGKARPSSRNAVRVPILDRLLRAVRFSILLTKGHHLTPVASHRTFRRMHHIGHRSHSCRIRPKCRANQT